MYFVFCIMRRLWGIW